MQSRTVMVMLCSLFCLQNFLLGLGIASEGFKAAMVAREVSNAQKLQKLKEEQKAAGAGEAAAGAAGEAAKPAGGEHCNKCICWKTRLNVRRICSGMSLHVFFCLLRVGMLIF